MLNGDWLTPLAAGVMCRKNDLPQDRSLAVTAAALVLNGPLALAPALVAVERKRRADADAAAAAAAAADGGTAANGTATGAGTNTPPAAATAIVEKARPLVPDLVGKYDRDGADKEIRRLNLVPEAHTSWDDAATKDLVFAQAPTAGPNVRVPEGSVIAYYLSAGPQPLPPPEAGDDDAAIQDLRKDMDGRFAGLDTKVDALTALIKALPTAAPPPPPPVPPSADPGTTGTAFAGGSTSKGPKG